MADIRCDVWLLHVARAVLVSESGIGVPALAVRSTDGTIGGTRYSGKDLIGTFPFARAERVGRRAARKRGYRIEHCIPTLGAHTVDVEFVTAREVLDLLPGEPEYQGLFPGG